MKKAYKELSGQVFHRAVAVALNRTAAKVKSGASREIRKEYKIRAKDISKDMRLSKAAAQKLKAGVISIGRPIPIMSFGARQTKKGVTANISGTRKRFPGAFIVRMSSGHIGVFARGKYKAGKFHSRHTRVKPWHLNDTTITELKTLSVPVAFSQDVIMQHLTQKIDSEFPIELGRVLNVFSSRHVQKMQNLDNKKSGLFV